MTFTVTRRYVRWDALLLVLGFVMLTLVTRAQDPLPPTFRGAVDVVHVDVVVLDKKRKPVRGLTAADFTVLEDGQPREIVAFSAVDLPEPQARRSRGQAAWVRTVPADVTSNALAPDGRAVVILFGPAAPANLPMAQRIARATVEAMAPGDLGAIVFSTRFFNAKAIQDFTSDKARLLQAIDRPFSPALIPPACNTCCFYEKAGLIADFLSPLQGRPKSIVFIGAPDSPSPYCGPAAQAAVRKLRSTNVTIHEIDLAGVSAPEMGLASRGTSPIRVGRQLTHGFLSDMTGGQTIHSDNVPESEVAPIFEETASYYVLAFPSSDTGPAAGQTHDITMRVSRPNVVVQARSDYQVGQTAKALEAEARKAPLVRSIETTLPRRDFAVRLSATPLAVPGTDKTTVAIALRLGADLPVGRRIAPEGRPPQGEVLNVFIAAIDPVFSTIAGSVTTKVEIPPLSEPGREHDVVARLDVAPGRYDIRAAIDSESGARAGVYTTIEVPDFRREALSMSGVALQVSPGSEPLLRASIADLLPVAPTARREFRPTDLVMAFVRIYQSDPSAQPVAVAAALTDTRGRVAFQNRRPQTGSDYALELPLEQLTPGEYLLTIEATAGKAKTSRNVRFTIQ